MGRGGGQTPGEYLVDTSAMLVGEKKRNETRKEEDTSCLT